MRCVQLWMENPSDQSQNSERRGQKQPKPNLTSEVAILIQAIMVRSWGDERAIRSQSRRDVGRPLSLQRVYHAGLIFPISIRAAITKSLARPPQPD
jgi:hypothetical protein